MSLVSKNELYICTYCCCFLVVSPRFLFHRIKGTTCFTFQSSKFFMWTVNDQKEKNKLTLAHSEKTNRNRTVESIAYRIVRSDSNQFEYSIIVMNQFSLNYSTLVVVVTFFDSICLSLSFFLSWMMYLTRWSN